MAFDVSSSSPPRSELWSKNLSELRISEGEIFQTEDKLFTCSHCDGGWKLIHIDPRTGDISPPIASLEG